MVLLFSVLLLSALAGVQFVGKVSAAGTDDWPMFRHDLQHSGYSTSTAPNTNQILWSYTIDSVVSSCPAVVDGKVYVGFWNAQMRCLSAETGALIWNYTTGASVISSPAVAGGKVYVGTYDKNLYCLNAETGALIWNYTAGNVVNSSPAVTDGKVYIGSDDKKVYCLNAATGAFIWNYTTGNTVRSSPAVANGKVYVGSWDNNVYCLNAETGALIWNYTTGNIVNSSPAVADGKVYVGSDDNQTYCLSATTGALIWNYTTGNDVESSPAVANGVVYVGSNDKKVYAFGAGPPIARALTLTPPAQAPGASVAVDGAGFGATNAVGIGFGAEVNVINEIMNTTGPYGIGTGPYTGNTAYLPIKPGTFRMSINISSTAWAEMVHDVAGNGTLDAIPLFVNATIDYVTGQYTCFTTGPAAPNYLHLVNYTRYEYNVTPAAGATTNSSGAFSASITVPSVANGNYVVTAIDTQGNMATATLNTVPEGLTLGVMLTLSTIAMIASKRYFRKRPK